ncbi:carboxypeptidase M32 [Paenibacillus albiflavus]|uniref:Metal-dependent carboxypeptidase n=1 Tax=Paenibacillus albiflavus TaxID=2545760 RepID=A0A4R4ELE4_9BACL|nr:carboxypeptidase M32 [Paenibacillus albiflavus]TCZ81074.1 carboxypeptidase M32 [Paenibacillus albiflavus]
MSLQEHDEQLQSFKQYIRKLKAYHEAIGLIYWDMRTGAPRKGLESRAEAVGELSAESFRMSVSEQMSNYLNYLTQPEVMEKLDAVERRMVQECKRDYDFSKKIPADKYQAYVVLTSQAEAAWEDAKGKNDWAGFAPYLEKIVATNKEFIELWGYERNPYDTLLDMYEPGMTVAKLDEVFGALREKVVPLLAAVSQSPNQPERGFLDQPFGKEQQRAFSMFILNELGFNFEAGRLDETVHPFATGLNPGDVRITTRFLPDDVASALFSTIHECGHAMYEQNISDTLVGTNLCTGTSMGIHESQSRFWENVVGRSEQFWKQYYPKLQETFPEQLGNVDVDSFYRAINHSEPSLIRTESDELTYNLHIMIRYELEKALYNGQIEVADLPDAWNTKYKEYLGVVADNYSEGILQDVHWSGGMFGYFPSYALGNMYAAQMLYACILKELPNFYELIEAGNLAPIKELLTKHVYQYGKQLTPNDIIQQMTGEELNPEYLVRYLTEKYTRLYDLQTV